MNDTEVPQYLTKEQQEAWDYVKTATVPLCDGWEYQLANALRTVAELRKAATEVAAKTLRDAAESVTNDPLTLDDFATWLCARADALLAATTPATSEEK